MNKHTKKTNLQNKAAFFHPSTTRLHEALTHHQAEKNKKSKQQQQAEKKAILSQRIPQLEISGFNASKLTEKAKELHQLIYKLEGEKYDLEKHFKSQQFDVRSSTKQSQCDFCSIVLYFVYYN